jgi:sugar lactone lactonase YvrE
LYQVTASGALRKLLSIPGLGLPYHTSLAAASDGSVYYADADAGKMYVARVGHAPRPLQPYPRLPRWQPQAIAADERGNLYVVDTGAGAIEQITSAGRLRVLASLQTPGFGASNQVTLTREPDGSLYTADGTTLLKVTPAGNVEMINTTDSIFQAVTLPRQQPAASTGMQRSVAASVPMDATTPFDGADGSAVRCLWDH